MTTYRDIRRFFAANAIDGPSGEPPEFILGVPENDAFGRVSYPWPGFLPADDFTKEQVDGIIDRTDGLFDPTLSGPEHFWLVAAKLTERGIPKTGPDSFFFWQNVWFDKRGGPAGELALEAQPDTITADAASLVALSNRAYWTAGEDAIEGAFGSVWFETRVYLIEAVNRYYPAEDYLGSDEEPADPVEEPDVPEAPDGATPPAVDDNLPRLDVSYGAAGEPVLVTIDTNGQLVQININ